MAGQKKEILVDRRSIGFPSFGLPGHNLSICIWFFGCQSDDRNFQLCQEKSFFTTSRIRLSR